MARHGGELQLHDVLSGRIVLSLKEPESSAGSSSSSSSSRYELSSRLGLSIEEVQDSVTCCAVGVSGLIAVGDVTGTVHLYNPGIVGRRNMQSKRYATQNWILYNTTQHPSYHYNSVL